MSRKTRAIFYAIAVHVIVVFVLVTNTDLISKPQPAQLTETPIVQARAVDATALEAARRRKEEIEAAKLREAQEQREQAEREARAEAERKAAAEAEKKRLAMEKAAALKAEREREAAAKKRRLAEEKRLAELKRKEEAEREKAREAAERKRRAEQKAREEEEQRQAALRDAIASEEQELAKAAQIKADEAEIARYIDAISARVANVFIYPDLKRGIKCTLYVRMIPGGEVIEARVVESSGDPAFDRQAENAVRKAAPLPVPSERRLFQRMREIRFVFDPQA